MTLYNIIYSKSHLTVIIGHILLHWWRSFLLNWEEVRIYDNEPKAN